MDVVESVRLGEAQFEWAELCSEHKGKKLIFSVMRDGMKFNGVRLPATAKQLQRIADELFCMMLTPKVIDLIWTEAGKSGVRFDPIINHQYPGRPKPTIVANMPPGDVSRLIDDEIQKAGGDNGRLIDSVGKYWVLVNELAPKRGKACNYGWLSNMAPYRSVLGFKCWQTPGTTHNSEHVDPSQLIRLMYRNAVLIDEQGEREVDLQDVAQLPELAPLISHQGVLSIVRQPDVPEPAVARGADGTYTLPTTTIYGRRQ